MNDDSKIKTEAFQSTVGEIQQSGFRASFIKLGSPDPGQPNAPKAVFIALVNENKEPVANITLSIEDAQFFRENLKRHIDRVLANMQ